MDKNTKPSTPNFSSKRPFLEGSDNEKLWAYMNNLWEDPAEYKVLMARRMLNLNYALMQEWGTRGNGQYLTDSIISNTAFLLSARTIADRYAYRKRFPRILICDDIMLHGRGIAKLICKFQNIVKEHLAESNVEVSERQLEADLYRSIGIYVFARNGDEGLLIRERNYRLLPSQILPMSRLRELSMQISDYLQSIGAANTSYVISVRLPWYQLKALSIERKMESEEAFQYKGRRQYVFFRERSPRILETMRICFPSGDMLNGAILTSLPIIGDIPRYSFEVLCRHTAYYMERNTRYSHIAGYLRMENKDLMKSKAQLLSFLYSIISIADFCRQNLKVEGSELYKILVNGDFNKIISNFDNSDLFRYEILNFFIDISKSKRIGSILRELLDQEVKDLDFNRKKNLNNRYTREFECISGPVGTRRRIEYEDTEDIFYEAGLDAEYDAYSHIRKGIEYNEDSPGYDLISFRQYMYIMYRKEVGWEHSVGCLFGLMDSGLISMNLEADRELTIRTVLKAGELATFILPRRFSIFIPALAEVERQYRAVGKYVEDVVSEFIDYIQDYCYPSGDCKDMRDVVILKTLQEKKSLLLYLYSTGQNFQDWNISLRTERLYLANKSADNEDDFNYDEEQMRTKYYWMCAKEFINQ